MFDWLHNLRQKPEPVRRLIAFWTSALVVFLIVGVWLAGLPGRIAPAASSVATAVKASKIDEVASPFEGMKEQLDNLSESFKGTLEYEGDTQVR